MLQHSQDESKRLAQHLLAKEIVELAHGAADAKAAEVAHKEAFSHGTNTFSLGALKRTLSEASSKANSANSATEELSQREQQLLDYKRVYASSSPALQKEDTTVVASKSDTSNVVTLPITLLQAGAFPRILRAAGLASSNSDAHRMISNQGAYVVVPNSGTPDNPHGMKWEAIPAAVNSVDPNHYLIDWEALVIRSGKSKIKICRIVTEEDFEAEGLSFPGWEDFKTKRAEVVKKL